MLCVLQVGQSGVSRLAQGLLLVSPSIATQTGNGTPISHKVGQLTGRQLCYPLRHTNHCYDNITSTHEPINIDNRQSTMNILLINILVICLINMVFNINTCVMASLCRLPSHKVLWNKWTKATLLKKEIKLLENTYTQLLFGLMQYLSSC